MPYGAESQAAASSQIVDGVVGVLPHDNMILDYAVAAGIQNSFWLLSLLFQISTYTLTTLKQ